MSKIKKMCVGHMVVWVLLVLAIPVVVPAAETQTVTMKDMLKLPDAAPSSHIVGMEKQ